MNGHLPLPKKPANHFLCGSPAPMHDSALRWQQTHTDLVLRSSARSQGTVVLLAAHVFHPLWQQTHACGRRTQGQGTTKSYEKQLKHINDLSSASIVSTCAGKTKRCQLSQRLNSTFNRVEGGNFIWQHYTVLGQLLLATYLAWLRIAFGSLRTGPNIWVEKSVSQSARLYNIISTVTTM